MKSRVVSAVGGSPLAGVAGWVGGLLLVSQLVQLAMRGGWTQAWLGATWTATFGVMMTAPLGAMLAWYATSSLRPTRALVEHGRRRPRAMDHLWVRLAVAGATAVLGSVVVAWAVVAVAGGIAGQWRWPNAVAWIPAALVVVCAVTTGHLVGRRWSNWWVGIVVGVAWFVVLVVGYLESEAVFRVGGMSASSVGLELRMLGQMVQIAVWLGVLAVLVAIARRRPVVGVVSAAVLLAGAAWMTGGASLLQSVPVELVCRGSVVEVCVPAQYVDEVEAGVLPTIEATADALAAADIDVPRQAVWAVDGAPVGQEGTFQLTGGDLGDPSFVPAAMVGSNITATCNDLLYTSQSTQEWDRAHDVVDQWGLQAEAELVTWPTGSPRDEPYPVEQDRLVTPTELRQAVDVLASCHP